MARPKMPIVQKDKQRVKKIDEMYRAIEAGIFMTIDDQPDAIYMASLLLTAAKNIFLQFMPLERTIEIMEMVVTDLKTRRTSSKHT